MVWTIFIASVLLMVMTAWNLWRRARGRNVVDAANKPLPWQWDAMFIAFGAIGVISTVPGLFFGQPHWAIDHVWKLFSARSGNAV